MNTTVEIAFVVIVMVGVYAACRGNWAAALAAVVGVLTLGLLRAARRLLSNLARGRIACAPRNLRQRSPGDEPGTFLCLQARGT